MRKILALERFEVPYWTFIDAPAGARRGLRHRQTLASPVTTARSKHRPAMSLASSLRGGSRSAGSGPAVPPSGMPRLGVAGKGRAGCFGGRRERARSEARLGPPL